MGVARPYRQIGIIWPGRVAPAIGLALTGHSAERLRLWGRDPVKSAAFTASIGRARAAACLADIGEGSTLCLYLPRYAGALEYEALPAPFPAGPLAPTTTERPEQIDLSEAYCPVGAGEVRVGRRLRAQCVQDSQKVDLPFALAG